MTEREKYLVDNGFVYITDYLWWERGTTRINYEDLEGMKQELLESIVNPKE